SLATQNLPRTSANEVPIGGMQGAPSRTPFDIPARLTFPLRFQANPGSQLVLLDYEATTGQYSRTPFFATVDDSGRNASAEITQLGSYVIAAPESSVAPMGGSSPINSVTGPPYADSVARASVSTKTASLANPKTMIRNSANFYKANPVQHLWNRSWTTSALSTAGGMGIGSFWMEFDFGALYNLTSARLFGDAKGTWWSKSWTLQYKLNPSDPWSTAFSGINAFFNNWSTQQLSTTARYVRVEVFGNPATGDTEARELQIYGTPLGDNVAVGNTPPTVNAGAAQTITLPSSATLNGTAADDGLPVGSTLTVTWSKVSGPGTVTFGNANALSTTASFSAAGIYSLRLTASDTALSSTSDVTITVNPTSAVNQPATVNAGPNQTITLPASASLNGTASDDDLPAGLTLTATWSKVSGPGTVTFGNVNALTTTASFSAAGTYVLRLTASDGALSSRDDVTITVNSAGGNANPPVVDAGPAKVIAFPAKDLTLFGHATDPDNDPLTVQWTSTSGPATVRFSAPWALATTVSFTATGTYTFQLAASDGTSTVTSSTTVTVNSASSQTAFYVDPTVTSAGSGTAASPWKSFEDGNSNQTAQWN